MAGLGWLGMGLPEACGGLPSSLADLYAFYLEMGRNLVDVPHLETVVVAGGLIAAAGGGAHDDLLPALAAGDAVVVPAFFERHDGMHAGCVELAFGTARRRLSGLLLYELGSAHIGN